MAIEFGWLTLSRVRTGSKLTSGTQHSDWQQADQWHPAFTLAASRLLGPSEQVDR